MLRSLLRSLRHLLEPLTPPPEDDDAGPPPWVRALGVVHHDAAALQLLQSSIGALRDQLRALGAADEVSFRTALDALALSRQAFTLLKGVEDAGGAMAGIPGIGKDLTAWLLGRWLQKQHPLLRQVAVLLTLIDAAEHRPPRPRLVADRRLVRGVQFVDGFALDRLGELLRHPVALLREAYLNDLATDADAAAVADKLFPHLASLLQQWDVPLRYGIASTDRAALGAGADLMAHTLVVYRDDPLAADGSESGLVLSLSPASRGDLGLVASPFGNLGGEWQFGAWRTELRLDATLDAVAWGRHGATLLPPEGQAQTPLRLVASASRAGEPLVLGDVAGTRLELGPISLHAALHLGDGTESLQLGADVGHAALVLAGGGEDAFLAELLPSDGLRLDFDLGLAWASGRGFSLSGGAGLDVELPLNRRVGPVQLQAIAVRLVPQADGVAAEVGATVRASIGPVQVTLKNLGMQARLRTTPADGNLGVADLSLGLTRPAGLGLALDTGGLLTGAGYLQHDASTGSYGGALQVSLHEGLTLNAYGLVTTRLTDGSSGHSLLVFIDAEGFKPVPLGFGLMLQRVGGMLGVHRRFDVDALRAGLRNDTLGALLFPRDPVANAPALMQSLASAFPVQPGSHLLGLLARITWFEPVLVQADLAVVLQLGSARRLLALARVSALLPSRDNDLIRLNLDAIGVLDFEAGAFAADAMLVDSRLARRFPITGSAALRASWAGGGQGSSFVLAVGGIHPRYSPPVDMPDLDRVSIALTSGRNPQLVCDAYFAITANTVQFGARARLHAEALGFTVVGDIGFDALVMLVPPRFVVDFRAAVQLKRGSRNLFKVTLSGTLEGPLPLRLSARARFEILWISFSVKLDFTLAAADRSVPAVAAVDLSAELRKALLEPGNWRSRGLTRAGGPASHGVALRALPQAAGLVLDPVGQLELRQQVVPLNTVRDIDTYGGLPVSGPRRMRLSAVVSGRPATPVTAAFAPARYFRMSDEDKLSAPSFEDLDAGLLLGDSASSFDAAAVVVAPLAYEQISLDEPPQAGGLATVVSASYLLPGSAFLEQAPSGAAARAPVRRQGGARFRGTGIQPFVTLVSPGWQVVPLDPPGSGAMAVVAPGHATTAMSWSAASHTLRTRQRGQRGWTLRPTHEHLA